MAAHELVVFQLWPLEPENSAQPLVTVYADGRVDLGPEYKPDRWARYFWSDIAEFNPWLARVAELELQVAELRLVLADQPGESPFRLAPSGELIPSQPLGDVADEAPTQVVDVSALRHRLKPRP
jgi:hypothetical protein